MKTIGTRKRQLSASSAALNNTRSSNNRLNQDEGGLNIIATTISAVNSTNSFDDSGEGLPVFDAGQLVEVSGFADNSRVWRVVSSVASSLVVDGGVVTDESAGASITIRAV